MYFFFFLCVCQLLNILKKYDINKRQVYSITCDNGANIVKMVKIFNENTEDQEFDDESEDESEEEVTNILNGMYLK